MAKGAAVFVCQACGAAASKWAGRCADCGGWNTLAQEAASAPGSALAAARKSKAPAAAFETLAAREEERARFTSGMPEFDRAIGGGFTPGSAILVGGDPGIGKSTLLMQIAAAAADAGRAAVYVSGEEATQQLRLRAARLGVDKSPVRVAAETGVAAIFAALDGAPPPDLLIIDSIQTLWSDVIDSAPGTVSQVRASAQALVSYAKKRGSAVILVGHVTKDGQIAGPKVIEHMVDTVLYFDGGDAQDFRLLRAMKNRFGPANEIGVFEMRGDGLRGVANPSELFLSGREANAPGAAVFAGVEGSRPLLVEIQALVAPSPFAAPRRAAVGWDLTRLAMILAVLDARCGVRLGQHDVYLNVAGGLKIAEPAADLAVAAALISAIAGEPLPPTCVYFGEVSLSGAVRQVGQTALRLKEAAKLGFNAAVIPGAGDAPPAEKGFKLSRIKTLRELEPHLMRAAVKRSRERAADDRLE
ncbi:MAG: DNA repair protein RadA [Hyphomicrobiales bacterium]|nr:DNA repair protein RadA [Hyphomicrobiales bacterium]